MAQEIYHRSEWGNPNEQWGNVYLNADLTNELYKRASEYENSWVTDQLLNGVGIKPSIILTPTAYEDGLLNSVKPKGGENLITYSEDFSQSVWAKTNLSILSNSIISPEGILSADKLIPDTTSGQHKIDITRTVTNGATVSLSAFVKKGEYNFCCLYEVTSSKGRFFDLSNGTQGGTFVGTPTTSNIENYNNDWYRISISTTVPSTSARYILYVCDTISNTSFVGDNIKGIYTWGAQLERGSRATTYIKTEGTAYKNADFDFTRGSSATRVNEQGLIQDVQILSGELVQNGDFEQIGTEEVSNGDFEQIGSELVVNGGFSDNSWWGLDPVWSISNGSANCIGSGTIYKGGVLTIGKTYKVQVEISSYTSGTLTYPNASYTLPSAVGSYTFYYKANSQTISFTGTNFTGSIDNVSVKEVGQDWTFGGEAIIDNGLVSFVSASNTYSYIRQDISSLSASLYRISVEVKNYVSGAVQIGFSGSSPNLQNLNVSANGVYTVELSPNANGDDLEVSREFGGGAFDFDIDNISVKEVGQNWTFGTGWSIEDGKAVKTSGTGSSLVQTVPTTTIGKKYKFTFDTIVTGGVANATLYGVAIPNFSTSGSQEHTIIATSTTGFSFFGNSFFEGSIDNISVIEITDDTDLPRINYTNFDYENGEVVPYSGEGSLLLEPQSTNLITYSEDFSQSYWNKTSTTITPNAVISPDGTLNATKVIGDGTNGIYVSQSGAIGLISRSIYIKSVVGNVNVVLKDPTLTVTSKLVSVTENWQRFELVENNGHGSSSGLWVDDIPSSGIYIWGAQLEQQSYATSYIPTEGSSKTRLADVCNNSGSSDLINSTEGVLYAEISVLDTSNIFDFGLYGNTSTNQCRIGFFNDDVYASLYNGSYQAQMSAPNNLSDFTKIAFKFSENDFALWIDGNEVATDTSGTTFNSGDLVKLNLSAQNGTSSLVTGNVKCVAVFKETDIDLEKLTTI